MKKYLMIALLSSSTFSVNSFAKNISCNIASAIDGQNQPDKKVILDEKANGNECAKSEIYLIPNTSVEVTIRGHFDCEPSGGLCPYIGPSVDGIEIHDKVGKNFSQAFGSCEKASEFINSQLISQTKSRVNVVVTCSLNN